MEAVMTFGNLRLRAKYSLLILGMMLALLMFIPQDFFAQTYSLTKISEKSNVRTDRRPIHVGFYDASVNKTFVCWMGAKSHPIVKELNHNTNKWSEDKVIGISPFVDKHNYPGMLKGKDGRIYVFHGCHNSTMKMTVSPNPLSIEGEWEDKFIDEAERASYPAPVVTVDGTFYVFYRDTRMTNGYSDDRPYQFVKSTDNGKTWTRQMAVDPFPRTTDNMTEVYNGKVTYEPPHGNQKAKIHLTWTICGEKVGKHAHATYGRNVYYAYLDPENDHLYNVSGVDLGTTIDCYESDEHCLVWDSGTQEPGQPMHLAALQISVTYRDNGLPLIYFFNAKENAAMTSTWDIADKKWTFSRIAKADGPRDSGEPRDIEKIGPESFRVYRPSGTDINVFKTKDAGANWEFETTIPVGQRISRVFAVDNFHKDAKLLLTEDGDATLDVGARDVFIGAVTAEFEPPYYPADIKKK